MSLIDGIKFMVGMVFALMDSMPQETTDGAGGMVKIPDANYSTLISDGVVGVAAAAGFSVTGLTDSQLRGAVAGFCGVARAYQKAPRVAV